MRKSRARKYIVLYEVLTEAQVEWLINYEMDTTFEPMYLDELAHHSMTFDAVAKYNLNWYESHTMGVYSNISTNVPYDE